MHNCERNNPSSQLSARTCVISAKEYVSPYHSGCIVSCIFSDKLFMSHSPRLRPSRGLWLSLIPRCFRIGLGLLAQVPCHRQHVIGTRCTPRPIVVPRRRAVRPRRQCCVPDDVADQHSAQADFFHDFFPLCCGRRGLPTDHCHTVVRQILGLLDSDARADAFGRQGTDPVTYFDGVVAIWPFFDPIPLANYDDRIHCLSPLCCGPRGLCYRLPRGSSVVPARIALASFLQGPIALRVLRRTWARVSGPANRLSGWSWRLQLQLRQAVIRLDGSLLPPSAL